MTEAEFLRIEWPACFVVEFADGRRERFLRGGGVTYVSAEDEPEGRGLLGATMAPTGSGQRSRIGTVLYLDEVKRISSESGLTLWSRDSGSEQPHGRT